MLCLVQTFSFLFSRKHLPLSYPLNKKHSNLYKSMKETKRLGSSFSNRISNKVRHWELVFEIVK